MTENRLIEIELKLASHDDTLDALNKLVYRQQRRIDELEALSRELAMRLRDLREGSGGAGGSANEPPPHY